MVTNINKSKPKTIEEWQKERRKKAKQENGFILIPMKLWNGEAHVDQPLNGAFPGLRFFTGASASRASCHAIVS